MERSSDVIRGEDRPGSKRSGTIAKTIATDDHARDVDAPANARVSQRVCCLRVDIGTLETLLPR
ncbi:hypothetical protein RRSWK_04253 [Rhodopirellula sp. SWK7]|nr:hypothetical protein RRSWK_04253 [Rhodopirellula sp. SWK7]